MRKEKGKRRDHMKKNNYKGRCEKRKVSKCVEVCRTYNKIQSAFIDGTIRDNPVARQD